MMMAIMASPTFLPYSSTTMSAAALQIPKTTTTTSMMMKNLPESSVAAAAGWRIALNIGRERFTSMPSNWASSGARLPLVFPCNFTTQQNEVIPIKGEVRYVDSRGEVVKPITKGNWTLDPPNQNNAQRKLTFTLTFPETMNRNNVILDAGTTVHCEGLLYTVQDIKDLNAQFYKARDKTDDAARRVSDISKRRDAPKKWDFEQQKWVKRYKEDSLFANLGKRVKLFGANMEEKRKSKKRPKATMLSVDSGPFPGLEGEVFIAKGGIVRGSNNAVMGTWSAEPITDRPASYFRPTY